MPALFSEQWLSEFGKTWNANPDLGDALASINYDSLIGYGFLGEDKPRGYIAVENGRVTDCGAYDGRDLDWDLRAREMNWEKWCKNGLGLIGLGIAYSTRKLVFKVGDYSAIIKNPAIAGPFITSFAVMGSIPRN